VVVLGWILRFFGWLLTPFVAWAASFLGATVGAGVGRLVADSKTGVILALVFGAAAAVASLLLWLRLLRRSPKLQHTLQVTEDGTPIAALGPEAEEATQASEPK
jgi:hypothetical protein